MADPPGHPLTKVVSGGQTGVDRAALDVAILLHIPCGGWCPRGRHAEDGVIPDRYPLTESSSNEYAQRTELNVRDSDATLILAVQELSGGTALTLRLAARHHKPCLVVDPGEPEEATIFPVWRAAHAIRVLNIAGPRESTSPGIYELSVRFLRKVLEEARKTS